MDFLDKGATDSAWNCSVEVEEENSDLRYDAAHVAKNLAFTVKDIRISDKLPQEPNLVYLNLTSLEGTSYCIELTERGYQIVGESYDTASSEAARSFESLNSLLETISPLYTAAFGNALMGRLSVLQKEQEDSVNIRLLDRGYVGLQEILGEAF